MGVFDVPVTINSVPKLQEQLTKMNGITAVGFGNSIMLLNATQPISSISSLVTVDVAAGQTSIPVASSAAFTVGQTLITLLYDASLFESVIASIPDSTHIVVTNPLPKQLHGATTVGQNVYQKFASTYGLLYGANAWLRILNAKMGNCFNFLNIYGYGGKNSSDVLPDFKSAVIDYKPKVCFLQILENDVRDINTGVLTVAQSISNVTSMITQCQKAGIFVVMNSCFSSNAFNVSGAVTAYDKLNNYWMSRNKSAKGFIVLPVHELWLDRQSSTTRQTLLGSLFTDAAGLHMNSYGAHQQVINIMYPTLSTLFGQTYKEQWGGLGDANNFAANPFMYGIGGIVNSPVTGQCPTLTNISMITASGTGVSGTTVSSLITEGVAQQAWQAVWSHTATSDSIGNQVIMKQNPVTCAVGTTVVGRVEVEIKNPTNIGQYGIQMDFGNGQVVRAVNFASSDPQLQSAVPSGRLVFETPPFTSPASGIGTVRLYFFTAPATGSTTSGCTMIWYKASIMNVNLPTS